MTRYPSIDLDGALVLVTGAARGIGLATARALAARGARVAIGDLDAELARREASALGPRAGASGHPLDVADRDSFATFVAGAEAAHGRPVDVLVNNAGIMPNGAFLEQDERVDRLTMDVNVHGVIHGMRLVLPGMVERGRGHVVNVASLAGKFPLPGLAVYNASKFAVVGLTAATRLEVEGTGVSVSAVLPSAVRTELSSGIDLGILPTVDPEDVARAVVDSVASRRAEVAVPAYAGALVGATALVPERALGVLRKVARDDAAITRVDPEVRDSYLRRIGAQR